MIGLALMIVGAMVARACGNYITQGNLSAAATSAIIAIGLFIMAGAAEIINAIDKKK